ncbi:hypothetical protein [Nocardia wallacei]|uniref:hypothetical protein n=1 Tax=Nocardia TaxID=1817 RepID=UPI0024580BAD|nr:hypothetical protein [Nocardia wallacei]
MTKPIHVDYGAAEIATGTIGQLVAAMIENTERLRGLQKGLEAVLKGAMGDGYTTTMTSFNTDLTNYDGAVKQLNATVSQNVNAGGHINQVDIQEGNRFAALGRS